MYTEDHAISDGLRDRVKILKALVNLAESQLQEVIASTLSLNLKAGKINLQSAIKNLDTFLRETE